jgi:hypothetical protein
VGFSRYSCKDETEPFFDNKEWQESEKCEVIRLKLVTIDGDYLFVKVMLNRIDMEIFLHELSPSFGKYKWWTPVISVYLRLKNDGLHALELVGRFQIDWDDEKKQIRKYKEERYYD